MGGLGEPVHPGTREVEHAGIGMVMAGPIVMVGTDHHVDPGGIGRAVAVT